MQTDSGITFTTNIRGGNNDAPSSAFFDEVDQDEDAAPHFRRFLRDFRIDNDYIYTTMLRDNLKAHLNFIEVNVEHLHSHNEALAQAVLLRPTQALRRLEVGAIEYANELKLFDAFDRRELQVQLFWPVEPVSIRQLAHEEVSRLVCISGIVIKASAAHARCTRAVIQCTSCRSKTVIPGGRANVELPNQCVESANGRVMGNKCRPNPYVLMTSECEFEDQQVLKLQELPDDVPTGELPRHTTVVVDRYLVDKAVPGSRVQIAGIVSVHEKKGGEKSGKSQSRGLRSTVGLRSQYLRGVGLMVAAARGTDGSSVMSINQNFSSRARSRAMSSWQAGEEMVFRKFAAEEDVYKVISEAIDPAVFGLKDQKRAIACLLFGGTRKKIGSNFLRGDMNVLFIGDPSTAKSQLLKFTEKIAPIGIYTSGKGSSAAGLTASVVGSGGGDFWLEAGSMVLADGGVVCIDEFDKMRDQDQVAIHEAMEQQTISIAKANLTTMLNSRTSVLAAANPTLGSYDPLRSNEDQMDFAGSILSRFDLIFKVLDPKDPEIDRTLARHVVNLHKTADPARFDAKQQRRQQVGRTTAAQQTYSLPFLTKYIAFARATCFPKISDEAKATLLDFFVKVRKDSHLLTLQAMGNQKGQAPIIQITARQLESLIRVTEALAKMRLQPLATPQDAEEAIRLFRVATVDAINSGVAENQLTEAQSEIVQRIEEAIRRRVAVGNTVLHSRLTAELSHLGFEAKMLDRALYIMMKRDEIEWRKQRTMIHRIR